MRLSCPWRRPVVFASLLALISPILPSALRAQAVPEQTPPNAPEPMRVEVPIATAASCPPNQSIQEPEDKQAAFWERVPPLRTLPHAGYWLMPPTGPGYYSLWLRLLDEPLPKPPRTPFPPTSGDPYGFFDADFRYLENPSFGEVDWLAPLKRFHPTDNWLFSLGGEERLRYMDDNGGYEIFTGRHNAYELIRSRVYGDLWFRDVFRVYAEMQDSRIANSSLPPLPSDVDHADVLNLFADLKLFSVNQQPAYVRVGRQELYFGSQRLISQSDWNNVLRTFQGTRAFWLGKDWNVDAFWVQPVLTRPLSPDPPDHNQNFSGLWLTYRPHPPQSKQQNIDLYYLDLDNQNPGVASGQGGILGGYNIRTVGSRYAGDYANYLWDFEAMYQFGSWSNQRDSAAAATAGLGYQFADRKLNPQFWMYNDWASGDQNPGTGHTHGTFNQLFPWGHNYFGYLDLVGRQNIDDLSTQVAFYPAKWIYSSVQYHVFHLDSARDALYNVAGVAIRRDPTGQAGTSVGDEIDFTTNFHLNSHQDIFLGFSKLFAGPFIRETAGPKTGPALFYLQYSYKW